MFVLVTYDINTESYGGARRLRQIAKTCQNHGQRVQNSVFECVITPAEFVSLKNKVFAIMDKEKDSIRFYLLGKNTAGKIEHYGAALAYEHDGPIIL